MLSTGYAVTGYEIYNLEEAAAPLLQPSLVTNQELFVTSWIFAWSMDYTDRVIRPTRGLRLRGSVGLGSQALAVKLTCAVYKDGFAVENIVHPIFELRPGRCYPQGLTLTVPLPSAEQAAVRESHRLQQARILSTVDDREQPRRPTRVWQAPPRAEPAEAPEGGMDEDAAEKTPRRNWWGRLWHRDSRGADSQDDE